MFVPSDTTATDAPIGMGTLVPLAVSTDKEKSVEPLPLVVESFTIIDLSAPLGMVKVLLPVKVPVNS